MPENENSNQGTSTEEQNQATTNTNPNPWVGTRLEEERRKATEKARREAEEEFQRNNADALKLANLYKQAGYDPAAVAAQYERELREAQARQVGVTPEVYNLMVQQQEQMRSIAEQTNDLRRLQHERDLGNLLIQAENQVLAADPRAKDYVDTIRQRMAFYANRFVDTVPNLDELVTEGVAAFRMVAWDKVQQEQRTATQQATLANQNYRSQHQALTPSSTAEPQLPTRSWQELVMSNKPEDRAVYTEIMRAVQGRDKAKTEELMVRYGLRSAGT